MERKNKINKILSDYNIVYYSSNFRLRIYGRDQNENNKITVRIEFKEKLPNCIPHLLNSVDSSFLSKFFTEKEENSERKIYFRCEIVNDNKIRNQVTKFQLRKLKNVTIEDIIKFVSSDKYKIEDNPEELIDFLKREYVQEWKEKYSKPLKVEPLKVEPLKVEPLKEKFKLSDLKKNQKNGGECREKNNKISLFEYKNKQKNFS